MNIIVLPSDTKVIVIEQPTISPELRKELLKAIQLLGPKEKERKMKFYKVTCYTPFVGEESDFYIKCCDEYDLRRKIDDCICDNAADWCDDQVLEENDMSEDDYYADCGASWEEITKEEYLKNCPWDREVV